MHLFKRWFDFYVFGNIHVALAAYSFTKITFLQFDIVNQPLANFIFFSTLLSYNLIRVFQIDKINSVMSIWFRANRKHLIVLNTAALLCALYFALNFRMKDLFVLLPLAGATLFYVFPFGSKTPGLRNVPGLKLFLIAATWAGVTVFLPLFSEDIHFSQERGWYALHRLLFVMAITIPFDIRDAQFDLPDLATIPQLMGTTGSKLIAIAALLICLLIDGMDLYGAAIYFPVNLSVIFLAMAMIIYSGMERNRYYTAFWIESLPIVWYLFDLFFIDKVVF